MVEFNGVLYSYVHNLQGDVVGIVDSAGSLVVEYKYDAWGKPTLVRTLTAAYEALAELNPFRYRGYVFDEETGLYYLRSRYYSPNCGRFINVDSYSGKRGKAMLITSLHIAIILRLLSLIRMAIQQRPLALFTISLFM